MTVSIPFTIVNHEGQTTVYPYTVQVVNQAQVPIGRVEGYESNSRTKTRLRTTVAVRGAGRCTVDGDRSQSEGPPRAHTSLAMS